MRQRVAGVAVSRSSFFHLSSERMPHSRTSCLCSAGSHAPTGRVEDLTKAMRSNLQKQLALAKKTQKQIILHIQ
jgi:hypothetical protein